MTWSTYGEAALLRAAKTALEAQGFRASDFCDAAIEGACAAG